MHAATSSRQSTAKLKIDLKTIDTKPTRLIDDLISTTAIKLDNSNIDGSCSLSQKAFSSCMNYDGF